MRGWLYELKHSTSVLTLLAALLTLPTGRVAAQDSDEDWDAILLREPEPKRPREPKFVRHARHRKGGGGTRINPNSWHAKSPHDFALHEGHAFTPLVIHVVGQTEPYVLVPDNEEGAFGEAAHATAREAFGGWEGGPSPHPRLLELIYSAILHFKASSIHLISGMRNDRKASRHSHGMAADIVLPGVRDDALAAFFRAQGFVGVGTYPRSGFVHIDVRDASYFWVDRSPPNKHWRVSQVRADESRAADQAAIARGQIPAVNPDGLTHALAVRVAKRRPKRTSSPHRSKARVSVRGARGSAPSDDEPAGANSVTGVSE